MDAFVSSFIFLVIQMFLQIQTGLARKCFVCDTSGLIFRQASNIPECYQRNGTELSDTIYYNIKINEFTPYKDGNGLCATGHRNYSPKYYWATSKYSWIMCEHARTKCIINEQWLTYLDWLFGGSRKTRNLSMPWTRACFCDTNASSTNINSNSSRKLLTSIGIIVLMISTIVSNIHLV